MAGGWLDSVINAMIFPIIILIVMFWLWKNFREPITGLGRWIKGLFASKEELKYDPLNPFGGGDLQGYAPS